MSLLAEPALSDFKFIDGGFGKLTSDYRVEAVAEPMELESPVTPSHSRLIDALKERYHFNNKDQISLFLLTNSFLSSILLEAPEHIYRIFGYVEIYLEHLFDPDEGTEELFILIKSPYPIDKSIRLEDQLFDEWFDDKIDSTQGKLNIAEVPA
jgi:hypothetical protein